MSVRKQTANRRSLIRVCGTCGKTFPTTAASPWMRSILGEDGHWRITYFCSSSCFQSSYKHIGWYDGKADIRRQEREESRDRSEYNRRYRESHREQINQRRRERYWENHEEELASNRYAKKKRKLLENPDKP